MSDLDDVWVPLVDEPIGSIVEQVQVEHPDIAALVDSPRKLLAFRTFAYIRVGILLGQLLLENDVPDYDGSDTWVDALLRNPQHREAVVADVRAVAEQIAREHADDEEPVGPDDDARRRFREFAKRQLG